MTPPTKRPARALAVAFGLVTLLPASGTSRANDFNCAVVYDEFESLMNKDFLVAPSELVQTLPGRVSQEQFEGVADAGFQLYPGREGLGIGVLNTNQNVHAKFLFHWSQPMVDGSRHVIIDEIVKYGRVADGYAPSRVGPFRLKRGMALDVDTGRYVPAEDGLGGEDPDAGPREAGDLKHEAVNGGAVLRSVNGAEVEFPLESMCR